MKVFIDTVHGEIQVPKDYCKHIIDTSFFQRLRRIEQTSMRDLYPSAHHDRFIHSLGTFWVGARIFEQIHQSLKRRFDDASLHKDSLYDEIKKINLICNKTGSNKNTWFSLKRSFELACLLHDVGHAPFSHTFEEYFYSQTSEINNDILAECNDFLSFHPEKKRITDDFLYDLRNIASDAKHHEMVGAWMVLSKDGFREILFELGADPILMARMITGCKFSKKDGNLSPEEKKIENEKDILNCFIKLLNGHGIDADRLDYGMRDKWASGLNSININLPRLISTLTLTKDTEGSSICFGKQALPELQSLIEIKNYTYFWVFKHHKIEYQQDLLVKAVEKMASIFLGDDHITNHIDFKEKKKIDMSTAFLGDDHITNHIDFKEKKKIDMSTAFLGDDHITNHIDFKEKKKIDMSTAQNDEEEIRIKGEINKKRYEILSYKNLLKPKTISFTLDGIVRRESFYLTSDDDIVHLLKKYFCIEKYENQSINDYITADNYAMEWFCRDRKFIPLWKSYSELKARYISKYTELNNLNMIISIFNDTFILEEDKITKIGKLLEKGDFRFIGKSEIAKLYEQLKETEKITEYHAIKSKMLKNIECFRDTIYLDKMENDFRKLLHNVLKQVEDKNSYKLNHNTIKHIPLDFNLAEVKPNELYIHIDNSKCCFTSLDLPKKSQRKNYKFFYFFVPRIFNKIDGKEVENTVYHEFYIKSLQKEIETFSHAEEPVILV